MPTSGPSSLSDLDFIIVRENTEGLYSGLEEVGVEESRTIEGDNAPRLGEDRRGGLRPGRGADRS